MQFSRSHQFSGVRSVLATKTLRRRCNHRRHGVHDACCEERLGHIQLAAIAADLRDDGEADGESEEGVGEPLGGARLRRDGDAAGAEPSPERPGDAVAVVLSGAAVAGVAAAVRQPQGFG